MNPHSGINGNDDDKARAITAMPMAGILVGLGLLSGLALLLGSSYDLALAQQNTTEDGNTTTTDDGIGAQASACAPTQDGSGSGGSSTRGTNATNTTNGASALENLSKTSEARMHIVDACMALQSGDTQGALMQLNLALNALEDSEMQRNVTTTASAAGSNTITGGEGDCDGITVGGTSAADDYDCTPDAE